MLVLTVSSLASSSICLTSTVPICSWDHVGKSFQFMQSRTVLMSFMLAFCSCDAARDRWKIEKWKVKPQERKHVNKKCIAICRVCLAGLPRVHSCFDGKWELKLVSLYLQPFVEPFLAAFCSAFSVFIPSILLSHTVTYLWFGFP